MLARPTVTAASRRSAAARLPQRRVKQCVEHDYLNMGRDRKVYQIVVEQEPGSGGKESAEATIRNLAGYNVVAYKPTGEKAVRAELVAQARGPRLSVEKRGYNRKDP